MHGELTHSSEPQPAHFWHSVSEVCVQAAVSKKPNWQTVHGMHCSFQ